VIPRARKIAAKRTSVVRFPFPRIRPITSDRFAFVQMSAIGRIVVTKAAAATTSPGRARAELGNVDGQGRPHPAAFTPHPRHAGLHSVTPSIPHDDPAVLRDEPRPPALAADVERGAPGSPLAVARFSLPRSG